MLKAWIRRHFEGTFGDFLRYVVARSRCDRFAKEHFRHSAGGYIFEADIRELEAQLAANTIEYDFE